MAVQHQAAAFDDGGAIGRQDYIAIKHQAPGLFMAEQFGAVRRQTDSAAVYRHHGLFDAARLGDHGMGFHVTAFTMDGNGDFRANPFVHGFQFGPTGVAGNVHMRLFLGDDLDTARGKRVLHAPDGQFIAGDLFG